METQAERRCICDERPLPYHRCPRHGKLDFELLCKTCGEDKDARRHDRRWCDGEFCDYIEEAVLR